MKDYPITRVWDEQHSGNKVPNYYPFHIGCYSTSLGQAHRHEYLELSLVVDREGTQNINGIHYPMLPGTFTFLLPYHIHKITPASKTIGLYNCRFDLNFLSRSSRVGVNSGIEKLLLLQEDLPPTIQLPESEVHIFEIILADMVHEYHGRDDLWKQDMLYSRLIELLIRFDRLRRQVNTVKSVETCSNQTIWPIIHYVATHFHEPISLSQVAEQFRISSPYLSSTFKKHTGLNFVSFLHEVRVRQACSLLASTNMNSMEIAMEVGFTSPQSFVRIFRKVKRLTPMEYRFQVKEVQHR